MSKEDNTKLAHKLAIISLRHCVSYYGRGDINRLAEKLKEYLDEHKAGAK